MGGKTYIGTSGWNYKSWRNGFYGDAPQKRWLRFCAERFSAIEVNGTFYRLQEKSTFKKWRDETPKDFVFAIKGHRYITHNKKLLDVGEAVIRCRESASPLGERLAAVVWQLPAFLKKNLARLEQFLKDLQHWKTTRHAIEFRHKSWFDDEIAECLERPEGCSLHVRRAGLADVGSSDDRSRLHPPPWSYEEVRIKLQQGRVWKNGRCASDWLKKTATCTFTSTMMPKALRRRMR